MTAPRHMVRHATQDCLKLEPPLLGKKGGGGFSWDSAPGSRKRDGRPHTSADPRPSPPSRPQLGVRGVGPAVPAVPDSSGGSPGRVLLSEPPSPAAVPPPPGYLQGRPPGAAPGPRGRPGARGLRAGASSGSAPAGLRVALPAAPRGCRSGRAARGGQGGGRGAAGRGLHPLLSTGTAKVRAQHGLDSRLPPGTDSDTPPPHAHPGQLGPHSPSRALCLRLEPPALGDDPSMGTQTQTLSPRRGAWCAQCGEGAAQG